MLTNILLCSIVFLMVLLFAIFRDMMDALLDIRHGTLLTAEMLHNLLTDVYGDEANEGKNEREKAVGETSNSNNISVQT